MNLFLKNEKGQVAKLLLILAAIVFVAIIITYLLVRVTEQPPGPTSEEGEEQEVLPVYEYQLGNIRFVFQSAIDKGSTLLATEAINSNYRARQDIVSTERFIIVTVGAQNKGLINIENRSWDLGNVIDSEGRNFVPLDNYIIESWVPEGSNCGALLKPEFDPTPCSKVYEVAKGSRELKIQVLAKEGRDDIGFNLDMVVR